MLNLINVTKRFDDKVIFDSFSYTFEKGLYIIHGSSGVGKTTLLRMIAGLDNDYEGSIEGGGASNVSISFQEYRLFPSLNAIDNLLLVYYDKPNEQSREEARAILSELGISNEDMQLYPSEMSGGMKLRVSVARAILKKTPILLLDEPTRELNREIVEVVARILSKEAVSRTVIIVTHDDIDSLFEEKTVVSL